MADLSFNLKLSPLFNLKLSSPLIFSKENFHGQNPYFGFRICVVLAVDSPLIFSKTRLNSLGQIRVFKPV